MMSAEQRGVGRGRLVDRRRSDGQCRDRRSGGDRDGEVPRRSDHDDAVRREPGTVDLLELLCAQRVVAEEVDRLRHLRVGLVGCLADLVGHDREEVAAARPHDVRRPQQDASAVLGAGLPPRGGCGAGACDDLVDCARVRQGDGRGGGARGSVAVVGPPRTVRGQGRIRVRLVPEHVRQDRKDRRRGPGRGGLAVARLDGAGGGGAARLGGAGGGGAARLGGAGGGGGAGRPRRRIPARGPVCDACGEERRRPWRSCR